jgi:hypothetical protein
VDAATADEAASAARHLYRRMRDAAGLPKADATILGYISPWWHQQSVATQLGQEATQLRNQGRYELSVLRLQTAVELHIRDALTRLLKQLRPDAQADRLLRRGATLADRQSQALVHLLTGTEVQRAPWWQNYEAHVNVVMPSLTAA